jgi:hypothetical protein
MKSSLAIARNGTQEYERLAAELSAEYVSVEERSVEQQLALMQKLASHIRFINLDNEPEGDWSGLFESDSADMLTYLDAPESFAVDKLGSNSEQRAQLDRLGQLSQPQRVLVYIFLRMSQMIRSQFNQLTQRHLDFYYRQVLQLSPSTGKPDSVHLTCVVADGTDGTTLTQGTLFSGGSDNQGLPVQYALDDNYQLNRAQISQINTLRVSREYQSLNQMRQLYQNGFEVIMRWALGQYFQGDQLPAYPLGRYFDSRVDIADLLEKYQAWSSNTPPAVEGSPEQLEYKNYIEVVLGFAAVDEFNDVMAVYAQAEDSARPHPDESQWITATDKIETAFNLRWQRKEMQQLVEIYRSSARGEKGRLHTLFEYVFGQPLPGDRLPAMPSTTDDLESLYEQLSDTSKKETDKYKLAGRYIGSLGMSVADFLFVYGMHEASAALYEMQLRQILDPNQDVQTSWFRFFKKFQRLEMQGRSKQLPRVGRWDIRNMLPNTDVKLDGGVAAFGVADNHQAAESYYGPGLAVVSSLLHMEEGERHIHLEIACKQKDFPMDDLLLAKSRNKLHFQLQLSGADGWQTLNTQANAETVDFAVANIGNDLIAAYNADQLSLVVALSDVKPVLFGEYLIFTDGSIWQVVGFGNDTLAGVQQLRLKYLSQVEGLSNERTLRLPQLDFVQEATSLTTLTYAASKQQVSLQTEDEGFGSAPEVIEQGDYLVLNSGLVLLVTQLTEEGRKAKVTSLGYMPAVVMTGLNGNSSGQNHYRFTSLAFKESDVLGKLDHQRLLGEAVDGGVTFNSRDIDRLIHFPNGLSFKIRHLVDAADDKDETDPDKPYHQALLDALPTETSSGIDLRIKKFNTFPGFIFDIKLDSTQASVTPAAKSEAIPGFAPTEAVLRVQLASVIDSSSANGAIDMAYEYLKDIRLHNVTLNVEVKGLTNLQLANDDSTLAVGQPFEPFGSQPYIGSALYFSHYELARKQLDNISLNMQWVDLPESLNNHYQAYRSAYPAQVPSLTNSAFQVGMEMFNQRAWIDQNKDKLLFNTDAEDTSHIRIEQGFKHSAYDFLPDYSRTPPASPLESERYFKLSLQSPDFQHKLYPHVLRKLGLETAQSEGAELPLINEPYTPKVKRFTVDYQASEIIAPSLNEQDEHAFLAHLHPFGGVNLNKVLDPNRPQDGVRLVPGFDDEGYLYLGLKDARPNDEISILVQVQTGSGEPNLDTPRLHWYYRNQTGLASLPAENLLHDTTKSMSFSGLIRVRLPADATLDGPLLPSEHHWLAVQVKNNADAAAKILAIKTQTVTARRTNPISAGSSAILPAGTVSSLVQSNSAISSVSQAYDSFGGLASANDKEYNRDASERLRHRNRAVNFWDYERLTLSRFPQLRQVKCLTSGEVPKAPLNQISMMVIPELSQQQLDAVLEPAASADLLEQIRQNLSEVAPPEVDIKVKNPVFQQLKFRVAVRFNPGFGPGIFSAEVVKQIKRLLTPWADAEATPLQFGNRLHFSEVINHLERQPYVDYVAALKCFKRVTLFPGSEEERQVFQEVEGKSIQVQRPDALLVSDTSHRVDIIASEHFAPEDYMGVGYMVIGLDNIVQ